ncbi:hypothetical protein [Actinophytocola xanthii]|uniref:Uncharacterized protein n=1 Tax=Actinophytocola xanthii TaxID=1912961 RepID=A0A1Q8CMB9_9PSEU|nr:hypothetical protein [Actinophytocola xanthii]OLF15504.1 hypothetical protein BU204_21510 [Actinophytocola xanthii]
MRQYLELRERHGPAEAREIALSGLPERQAARLGPLIGSASLAEGLSAAVPGLAAVGITTDFVDVSTEAEDAALEIMLTCTCRVAAEGLGLAETEAEPVLCELDLLATERAFPDLDVRVLARQTDRRNVCVFRFARPRLETT